MVEYIVNPLGIGYLFDLVGVTQPIEQVFVREERESILSHAHRLCLGWYNI